MRKRSPSEVGMVVGALVMCGALIWIFHGRSGTSPTPTALNPDETKAVAKKKKKVVSTLREVSVWDTNVQQKSFQPKFQSVSAPVDRAAPVAPAPAPGDPAAQHARDLTARITQLTTSGPLTREQAAEINGLLTQLAGEGPRAIPAIREFLESNRDYSYDNIQGGDQVNYKTLRLGMLDTLQQIGGPEASAVSAATLQTTPDPLEIALLSRYLEQQAPAQYRTIELTAAKDLLAQAASGHESYGDMSPVFEMLQSYGDTNVVGDLESAASRWNYYATLALAGLTNGAGVPSLIRLAQNPAIASMGSGDIALRPLAQAALQYPTAANALVDLARQNQVPDTAWETVSAALAGSYIQYGNQIFGSTSPTLDWSPAQITQRMALINQLLSVATSPTGRNALQKALTSLSGRLPK